MKNCTGILAALILLLSGTCIGQVKSSYEVTSPDSKTKLFIGLNGQKDLLYRVSFNGEELTAWSKLGLVINTVKIGENTTIVHGWRSAHKESFAWSLGENDHISNNYNQLTLGCSSSALAFHIVVRVFNGSVAFRYELPQQSSLKSARISSEQTEFNMKNPYTIYQYNQESVFTPTPIDSLNSTCDFPATLVSKHHRYVSIGEADNHNYFKSELVKGKLSNSLSMIFHSALNHRDEESITKKSPSVFFSGQFQSPWRTISIAENAIGLHQASELNLKLTAPTSAKWPTGIKPGKLVRSQLNTQSGIDAVNFAASHNFQYVLFDAGWYGAEFRTTSDPEKVIPQLDLQRVIQEGKQKDIGIVLYVNAVGLRMKLDTLLPLYKKWGVSGLKFGFVDGLTQKGISWLDTAIRKVNQYGFVLDIHDNYKPTGLSRRYPFLLTQEGIRGDENSPDAFHNTVLPFTRFLAGPADFTFCYPNSKNNFSKNLKVSKAQQLALSVIYFSPLQSIFWYGTPLDYTNEPEIDFFTRVPTVWNESRYLAGEIGENISVARRQGGNWYIGSAAGLNDWTTTLKLDFLTDKKLYTATVYEDDQLNGIRIRKIRVKKNDIFSIEIKAKCGQAIIISPEKI
ncbi:alpha-glucosidase [Mucilaginibacter gossypiicola]|uniref:Alpha-glucosidase n=1 Tax=Mucilaginibacter gossypiicola TaxID=551995 RepID=A0A1H8LR61_9SPHI|nr:glycoside hydrolase family 97 protein [Mucilaginibacter gossypiicola]SEO07573.1 alpha-glucosidase [Mucilaginibacter gossypiicola]